MGSPNFSEGFRRGFRGFALIPKLKLLEVSMGTDGILRSCVEIANWCWAVCRRCTFDGKKMWRMVFAIFKLKHLSGDPVTIKFYFDLFLQIGWQPLAMIAR